MNLDFSAISAFSAVNLVFAQLFWGGEILNAIFAS
jgi:hypothetical protein